LILSANDSKRKVFISRLFYIVFMKYGSKHVKNGH
jgi:hypothetical protein